MDAQKPKNEKPWNRDDYQLFIGAFLGIAFLFVFSFVPMFGIVLAFQNGDRSMNIINTIFTAEFVGLDNFKAFLYDAQFMNILLNTVCLNLLMLFINFPAPIIFALFVNEISCKKFMKTVQATTIFPHFLSWTVFGGIVLALIHPTTGLVNPILELFGLSDPADPVNLQTARYTWVTIIISSLIKNTGWSSIIYLAAISGIDGMLYEAAEIDGAGRFRKMISITLPSISSTITIYLLLNISRLLTNSFEQFYIFQNGVNLSRSEVLTTYIYKMGIGSDIRRFSYTTAIGFFESVIGMLLLVISNAISKKISGRGIF